MNEVTLVLTRTPLHEFIYTSLGKEKINEATDDLTADARSRLYQGDIHYSGRWGTLGLFRGPKIYSVRFQDILPARASIIVPALGVASKGAEPVSDPSDPFSQGRMSPTRVQTVKVADRVLELFTDPRSVAFVNEYTSMERYRKNDGSLKDRYIMLHPRSQAYPLRFEPNNSVVKKLRDHHNGNCVRVLDTNPGAESGILIHEAPNVTWLIGCISPRPKGNKTVFNNVDGNPSFVAMSEIINELKQAGGQGSLFVLI